MNEKCFCHFNGYEVKDAQARRNIKDLTEKVEAMNLTSVVVNDKSEMSDITKIYINKSDNNWYYYDTEELTFVVGGQFIYEMDGAINYEDLTLQIKRCLFPFKNIEWKYDDMTNIPNLYSNLYYYGGYFINNSELELDVKIKKLDITGKVSEQTTITLSKGETYELDNECYYNVEISKSNGELFELLETIQLSTQFNFISNIFRLDELEEQIKNIESTGISFEVENSLESGSSVNVPTVNAVKSKTPENITTNGEPVKRGYKVDGKDVYVQRFYIETLPATTEETQYSIDLNLGNVTVIEFNGIAFNSSVFLQLPYFHEKYIYMWLMRTTNSIGIQCSENRTGLSAYVNVYFTYND